tara:strand:+ start:1238 stop:2173 length:936 start_codon:yes stop_codon:yes gene_type:complete
MEYLVFKKNYQKLFLEKVKENTNKNYTNLAKELGVTKGMISHLVNERCNLKEDFYTKLHDLAKIKTNEFEKYVLYRNKLRNSEINIPIKPSYKLAELIGIYLGDGNLYHKTYGLTITCGKIDYNYITKYVPKLIKDIFNKEGLIYNSKKSKAINYRIYSKDICSYLINNFNLSYGKKINTEIPKIIFQNKSFLKACVRGLIDTDGGIYRHHKTNLQIIFFNSQISLINSIKNALESLGFNPRIGKNNQNFCIYLFGKEAIRYYHEIGFNNPKNIIKFNFWIKNNRIPLNKEIEDLCVSRGLNPDSNVFATK